MFPKAVVVGQADCGEEGGETHIRFISSFFFQLDLFKGLETLDYSFMKD